MYKIQFTQRELKAAIKQQKNTAPGDRPWNSTLGSTNCEILGNGVDESLFSDNLVIYIYYNKKPKSGS